MNSDYPSIQSWGDYPGTNTMSSPLLRDSLSRKLGTFSGVFVPVCLSMFSALLFLRIGYVVGQAGILFGVAMYLVAYQILTCTVLSTAAICTNGAVEGGGAYYIISRTMGPEFGGSIGMLLYFANIFSSALCISGFVEGLIANFGPTGSIAPHYLLDGIWWRYLLASGVALFNMIICIIGAKMFARTSLVIFATVIVSCFSVIVSFFAQHDLVVHYNHFGDNYTHNISYGGIEWDTFYNNLFADFSRDYTTNNVGNFAIVFGVLFSGVTGILAGANMSGDLKDPGRSIPKGTLWAVVFTFATFMILTLLTAASCSKELLLNDYIYMQDINLWPPFVAIGISAATLSASLSCMIGASRVLEAVAKDDLFGILLRFVHKGTFRNNPIVAVIISWALVLVILLIGSLNVIAQLTSVLFLLCYFAINLSCLGLELASAPNFRPVFRRFSWHTCMIGVLGTLIMMFVISPIYAAICIILCLLIIIALHLRAVPVDWGSISQALIFHQVRKYLLMLDSRKEHVKFWRPQMLLLVANPRSDRPLIEFVNDLKKSGLYILGHVKLGDFSSQSNDSQLIEENNFWLNLIDTVKVKAFVEVTVAASVREGMHHLARIAGLGAMKPNTLILGFYDTSEPRNFFTESGSCSTSSSISEELYSIRSPTQPKNLSAEEYVDIILDSKRLRKNLCLCRNFHMLDKTKLQMNSHPVFIDVWPFNLLNPVNPDLTDTTTLFILQLSCVLHMVSTWKHHTIVRVMACATGMDFMLAKVEEKLQELRIMASVTEVPLPPNLPPISSSVIGISDEYVNSMNRLIQQYSQHTVVTFLYLPIPEYELDSKSRYLQVLDMLTVNLPPTVLVHGVSPVTTTSL